MLSEEPMTIPCRFCGASLRDTLVDLGMPPLCETFVARRRTLERHGAVLPAPRVGSASGASSSSSPEYVAREEIFTRVRLLLVLLRLLGRARTPVRRRR